MKIELQDPSSNEHLKILHKMIVADRNSHRMSMIFNIFDFKRYVEKNIDEICEQLNTRWLVSICDTYAGNCLCLGKEGSEAMSIVVFVNMIKLWDTDLKTRGEQQDDLVDKYCGHQEVLWDGIITYDLRDGDMIVNMVGRLRKSMEEGSVCSKIFETILGRIDSSKSNNALKALVKQQIEKR